MSSKNYASLNDDDGGDGDESKGLSHNLPCCGVGGGSACGSLRTALPSHARPSCAVACLISIGSLCVGYSLGFTSPATAQLLVKNGSILQTHGRNMSLNEQDISWFGSAVFLGALTGGIIGGPLAGYLGRRIAIMIGNALFIVGWALIAPAVNLAMLITGRVIIGLAVGISVLVNPIYLAEVVLPELRGALTTTLQLSVSLGIVLSYGVGISLSYRHMAILGACISGVFALMLFLIPETPRWYLRNGKREKGIQSLKTLRGSHNPVYAECSAIEAKIEEEKSIPKFSLRELRLRHIYQPLLLSIALMLFQVWSGSYAVTAYTTIIFDGAGLSSRATVVSIGVALVQFVVTAGSLLLIDRSGRRPLLIAAGSGMTVACTLMALFFVFSHHFTGTAAIATPIFAIYFYMAAYSLGLGIIPWLFMAEVFPARAKSVLSSASAATSWLNAFLMTRYFEPLTEAIGNGGVFVMLAVVCLILVLFTWLVLPETKNKTLEEIEGMFQKHSTSLSQEVSAAAVAEPCEPDEEV